MNFSGGVKHTHPLKFITLELLLSGIFTQKSCKVELRAYKYIYFIFFVDIIS